MPGILCRDLSDLGALYRTIDRLQYRRRDPRRVCAVHRCRLVQVTGNSYAPAAYVIVAAIVTLAILSRTRETAFAPLR